MKRQHWGAVGLLWIVGLCGLLVEGQTCREWDGEPSFCSEFIPAGAKVFVPPDFDTEARLTQLRLIINGAASVGVPEECNKLFFPMLCLNYYRPCVSFNNETFPLPQQLCRSICTEFLVSACIPHSDKVGYAYGFGLYFPPGFDAPVTCNETDAWAQNVSFFPAVNTTYIIPWEGMDREVDVLCTYFDSTTVNTRCDPPLVRLDDGRCGFACPLPAYDDDEYDALKVMQMVFGWLSLAGSMSLVLSYVLHPKLRMFPAHLVLMTAISACIIAGGMLLPSFHHDDEAFWCGEDGTNYVPTNTIVDGSGTAEFELVFETDELLAKGSLCTFQGVVLHFGFLAATFWWAITSVNLFLELRFAERASSRAGRKVRMIVYHTFGWGLSALLALIPGVADRIAFPPGGTFCFVSSENSSAFATVFWVVPVGLSLAVGLILFVASVVRIIMVSMKAHRLKSAAGTQIRVLTYVLLFLVVYCFIFAYGVQTEVAKDDIAEGWTDYFLCVYSHEPSCSLAESASNYPLAVLRGFAFSSMGLLLFFTLFFTKPILGMWWQLAQGAYRRDLSALEMATTKTGKGRQTKGSTPAMKTRTPTREPTSTSSIEPLPDPSSS